MERGHHSAKPVSPGQESEAQGISSSGNGKMSQSGMLPNSSVSHASTSGSSMIGSSSHPSSSQTGYANPFPFSALSLRGLGSNTVGIRSAPSPISSSTTSREREPAPLLSSQYETLSDIESD
uniref:Uncharacterized protein n=1 Tax=Saccoglossus kowalevskii TaxID=10224 RepID=A0ABM0MFN8_SACKO|nr:PREDICTED: putative protein TPRXL-like [Saccoglossus kowalevskii]